MLRQHARKLSHVAIQPLMEKRYGRDQEADRVKDNGQEKERKENYRSLFQAEAISHEAKFKVIYEYVFWKCFNV